MGETLQSSGTVVMVSNMQNRIIRFADWKALTQPYENGRRYSAGSAKLLRGNPSIPTSVENDQFCILSLFSS